MWCRGLDQIRISAQFVLFLAAIATTGAVPTRASGASYVAELPDSAALAAMAFSLGDLPGFNSTAARDDATALYANPAGIDRSVPLGYYFAWDSGMRGRGDLATLGVTAGAAGFGYQQVRPARADRFSRTTFAVGGGSRTPVSLGLRGSHEHQARVGPDEAAWRWDVGLMWCPARAFSFGALARDLTQERMFGALYRRSYAVGIGVRPLPWNDRSRVTLLADLTGGEQDVWKDHARLAVGGLVELLPGLELSGSMEGSLGAFFEDRVVRLAVGLNARRNSVWGGTRYERRGGEDERMGHILAFQGTVALQRPMKKESVLARIRLAGAYGDGGQSGVPIPIPMIGSPYPRAQREVQRRRRSMRRRSEARAFARAAGAGRRGRPSRCSMTQ